MTDTRNGTLDPMLTCTGCLEAGAVTKYDEGGRYCSRCGTYAGPGPAPLTPVVTTIENASAAQLREAAERRELIAYRDQLRQELARVEAALGGCQAPTNRRQRRALEAQARRDAAKLACAARAAS